MDVWNGFQKEDFTFEGKRAILVFPKKADEKKNWMLKTEYWDAFPEREIDLVNRGFHLAYLENETRFATKSDCDRKARFADYLCEQYGLSPKCVPVGMSCGGAHAVNFAGFYPEKIACIYIDAPVLNFMDFPGRLEDQGCEAVWENEFVKAYPGITRAGLFQFDNHPMNKIPVLKEHQIPIVMLYGTEDQTVFYSKNGQILELEYQNNPLLKIFPRFCQGHHPHGCLQNPEELIEYIITKCKEREAK